MKRAIVFFSCLFVLSCNSKKNLPVNNHKINALALQNSTKFDIQGHRGCRGLMPENTIPAMIKALDLGVSTLEMDISFSKDKKALLSHEPFFNHEITTMPDGSTLAENEDRNYNLYQMDYDSIVKYDVGLKKHPRFPLQENFKVSKPLLSDLFVAVKNYMKQSKRTHPFFNIETKCRPETDNLYHPEPDEFVNMLMKVILDNQMEEYTIIQSFDFRTLQYLHKHYPAIKTAMLIEDSDKTTLEQQIKTLGFTPTIYSPSFNLVSKKLIDKCQNQKIEIIPWTVNSKVEIIKLMRLGVDGIITDYPNFFQNQLDN